MLYIFTDCFVKVYLLQNGKKISKKKTSTKKDQKNPIFNEAIIFSVPASALSVSAYCSKFVIEYDSRII